MTVYTMTQMQFLFGQYILIPKKKIGHNQKGTTLEPLGTGKDDSLRSPFEDGSGFLGSHMSAPLFPQVGTCLDP